jgi:glycosyltransferase involved in cell wall biosynthesis
VKFSVIVPAYREEKLIEKTLLSIRRQTFKGYELIVVVRPANDRTEEIAGRYADKVVIQRGKGLGAARNLGAIEARGEILIFLDADTMVTQDFLERLNTLFSDHRVLSIVPRFYTYDRSKRGAIVQCLLSLLSKMVNKAKFLLYGMALSIRRDVFNALGGFQNVFGEDVNLSFSLGRKYVFNRRMVRYVPDLVVYTSSRRIEELGILGGLHLWVYNILRWWLLNRPFVGYLGGD